jgi:hypothetical protein
MRETASAVETGFLLKGECALLSCRTEDDTSSYQFSLAGVKDVKILSHSERQCGLCGRLD